MHRERRTIVSVTPVPVAYDSRTYKQATSLARIGYRSIVIAAGQRLEFSPEGPLSLAATNPPAPARLWLKPLRRTPILVPALAVAWGTAILWRTLATVRKLPLADAFVLHEFSGFPAVAARARAVRAPIIYDAHDFYSGIEPPDQLPVFDRAIVQPVGRFIERRCIDSAAAVMTVSDGIARLIRHAYGVEPLVVRNVHDSRLDILVTPLRLRLGIPNDAFVIATIGNRKLGQDISSALQALARLPDRFHWLWIGQGYDDLLKLAARNQVENRTHLASGISVRELVPSLAGIDLAIMLYRPRSDNYRYALPNGFFQATAAGLPQIVPPLPEIERLVERYKHAVLVDPSDAIGLASAVHLLANDRAALNKLASAARHTADQLSWIEEERLFLGVVAKALSTRHSTGPLLRASGTP